MNFEKDFDLEKVQVCTKRFVNGTQLQCNWGDGYLIGPWFGHEADAKDWKDFLEHTINRAVHGIQHDDYDNIVAERDTLSSQVATLSAQIAELTNSESVLKAENQSLRDEVQIFRESGLKGKLSDLYSLIGGMLDDAADQAIDQVIDQVTSLDDFVNIDNGIVVDSAEPTDLFDDLDDHKENILKCLDVMTAQDALKVYNRLVAEFYGEHTREGKGVVAKKYCTMSGISDKTGLSYPTVHNNLFINNASLFNRGLVARIYNRKKQGPVLFFIPKDSIEREKDAIEFDNIVVDDVLTYARILKVFGYTYQQVNTRVTNLPGALKDVNLHFRDLCTKKDKEFMNLFDQPLFEVNTLMGYKERISRKDIVTYLLDKKIAMICNDVDTYAIEEIAEELKVHPAYIWAVCIFKNIPFKMDNNSDVFEMKPAKPLTVSERIDLMGGIDFLKNCKASGLSQQDIVDKYCLGYQTLVSNYIRSHGEVWSKW